MFKIATVSIVVIALAGCAGRMTYTGPTLQPHVEQEKTVQQPFERTWSRTVKTLQDRAYTVESADKRTGLIRLRVAGNPEPYIDCGQIESMVATPRAKITRVYEFPAAIGHKAYEQLMRGNIWDVLRDMHMESVVDLQLQPAGRQHTRAALSTRYQLTRTVQISNATHKRYEPVSDTIVFTTSSPGRFPGDQKATTCVATGALEREIFGLVP